MSETVLNRLLIAQGGSNPSRRIDGEPAATPRLLESRPGVPRGPPAGRAASAVGRSPRAAQPTVVPPRLPRSPTRPRPLGPTFRANPFPEVTDPFCRLPLPTLFHRLEAASPWRPDAVMSTTGREHDRRPPGFQGPSGAHRTPRRLGRSTSRPTLSPVNPIPGPSGCVPRAAAVKKKREPFSGPPPASRGSFALPRRPSRAPVQEY